MAPSHRTPNSQAWPYWGPAAWNPVTNSCVLRGPESQPSQGHLTTQGCAGQDQKGPSCGQQEELGQPAA